ncbi:MAG: XRE family transcriptional regulator [Clostridiales bacterium]|nr:XRE family transcriptional regulator [Clostridiales bacterium]
MSIGTNIKKRRYELRMSQKELANALGYKTHSTIAKIEAGENDVSHKKLERFAEVLDTTPEALISGNFTDFSSKSDFKTKEPDTSIIIPDPQTDEGPITKTAAIILAGGKSGRNNQNIPSQFININEKPMLVYSTEAYQAHPSVDDIYIVCLKGWENIVKAYIKRYNLTKVRALIAGGASGIESLKNAINYIKPRYTPEDMIIIQESTRPMVNTETISKLLQASSEVGSATISHTMNEYVQFYVNNHSEVNTYKNKVNYDDDLNSNINALPHNKSSNVTYVNRNSIVALQSPEAHRLSLILEVFETAKKQQHQLSESCFTMLMYNLGYNINFIEGGMNNIKIVRKEDLMMFSALV